MKEKLGKSLKAPQFGSWLTRPLFRHILGARNFLLTMPHRGSKNREHKLAGDIFRCVDTYRGGNVDANNLFHKWPIEIGSALLLQLSGENRGYKTNIVGFKAPQYLIIEMPKVSGIESKIEDGSRVIGAMVSMGRIVNFECNIISTVLKPVRLIVTTFPESKGYRNLRKSRRIECKIPAKIGFNSGTTMEHAGIIVNISSGGCRYFTRSVSGSRSQSQVGTKVDLVFKLNHGEIEKIVHGEILRIQPESKGAFFNIRFCDNDEPIIADINEYIMQLATLLP